MRCLPFILLSIGCLLAAGTAHGRPQLSFSSSTITVGDPSTTVDLLLTNSGASALDISDFGVTVNSSDFDVSGVDYPSGIPPYLFAGSSLGQSIPTSLSFDSFPTTLFTVADSHITAPPTGFTSVAPGATVSLAEVTIDTSGRAVGEQTTLDFNSSFSSITLANGTTLADADIDYFSAMFEVEALAPPTPSGPVTPEPASLLIFSVAVTVLAAWRYYGSRWA